MSVDSLEMSGRRGALLDAHLDGLFIGCWKNERASGELAAFGIPRFQGMVDMLDPIRTSVHLKINSKLKQHCIGTSQYDPRGLLGRSEGNSDGIWLPFGVFQH